MKIAIIGAGPAGLACALECEKLGIIADVFERDREVGWVWPQVVVYLSFFERRLGDVHSHLKETYGIYVKPLAEFRHLVMRSPHAETKIDGKLGYFWERGKGASSLENQLLAELKQTPVHYNRPADYKELARKYDYVVVATGKDTTPKELDVWEDCGRVVMLGGVAMGSFDPTTSVVYANTDYAGSGYARLTPINETQALVGLYCIGKKPDEADSLFGRFVEMEGLAHLEFLYKITPAAFSTGRVRKARIGNVLLAGRAAGLVERFMGTGLSYAIASGVMAARAMIRDMDYDELLRPMWDHLENLSSFRQYFETMNNDGYDKLIGTLGNPIVQGAIYHTGLNFADIIGGILKGVYH
ncbi:MAG TPA: dehydrogenase [Spirochaetia bacterium]|nr:dehydrogenase [Spirochaetia bacterium]